MNALVVTTAPALPIELMPNLLLARDFALAAKSRATRMAYESDCRVFAAWCDARGLCAWPPAPATLAMFLAAEAARGRRPSTISRRLAAIKDRLEALGLLGETEKSPTAHRTVRDVMAGIRRSAGVAVVRKAPILPELAIAMTTDTGSLRALRNRAIVLVGLASAMRRSELVALNVDDVEWREGGIIIHIRQSKGDQGGEGQQVGVMKGSTACPVAALRAWLEAAAISEGPIFRRIRNKIAQRVTAERLNARNIALVVKQGAAKLGLDPTDYAGHSLRRGHVTAAVRRGVNVVKIAEQTRHKDLSLIITYTKTEQLLSGDNSSAGLL